MIEDEELGSIPTQASRVQVNDRRLLRIQYAHQANLGPYDAIHVGAAAPTLPQALVDQLAKPGRMFIPVGTYSQVVLQVDKDEQGEVTTKEILDVMVRSLALLIAGYTIYDMSTNCSTCLLLISRASERWIVIKKYKELVPELYHQ
jgi:hypothetical protein